MIFLRLLEPLGADFTVYFEAAKTILAGVNPYTWKLFNGFPFNYPPTSLLFLWPLGLLPFNIAAVTWNILSLTALLLSIYLIYKKMNLKLLFLFFLFTIPFFPTKFNFGMGQINNFVLLFSILGLSNPFFLALATGIKFAPVIFALYFVITRDWKKLKRYLIYLTLLVLLSFILVPPNFQFAYYTRVLPLSFTDGAKDWYYNQSLYGFLARTIVSKEIVKIVFYILASIIVFVTIIIKTDNRRKLAAVSSLYLLIHPIALQHYFGFALIPLILLGLNPGTVVAYILLAANIKHPEFIPRDVNFILSHQFFGILLLWAQSLKITKVVWVITVLLFYVFILINTGLSR